MSIPSSWSALKTLKTELNEAKLTVTLDRGRSNPMNGEMVRELRDLFREIPQQDEVKGVILTGKPGFFSVGLDVLELYEYEKDDLMSFWHALADMAHAMHACNTPVVAAINGHSPAGGCVLALTCDYRVMAQGKYSIGLNEVPVGIIIPPMIADMYRFVIGQGRAYQMILEGALLKPEAALAIHLVDEVVELDAVQERAEAKLEQYMRLNPVAFAQSKSNMKRSLLAGFERDKADFDGVFGPTLHHWWSPEFRSQLAAMIERLKA